MTAVAQKIAPENEGAAIVVEKILPQSPDAVWRQLTAGTAMAHWIMAPVGFAPVAGQRFTFRTTPSGAWDGTIRCQVLDVVPHARFAFSWQSGDAGNVGYGSPLDTIVTFELEPAGGGTRLRLVHAGFVLPRNETAHRNMGAGWPACVAKLSVIAAERA